jgi:NodT family efflux transporter outer membrane factor (OMF) lipoprotein
MKEMLNRYNYTFAAALAFALVLAGCNVPRNVGMTEDKSMPETYGSAQSDSAYTALMSWKEYFGDPMLAALIDTALIRNQELNITLQEIEISRNEIRARKGEFLPFVDLGAGAGLDKAGKFTRLGAVDESLDIRPGEAIPEPLTDFMVGAYATWEIDVWKKLRNAKKSAVSQYLSSVEGKNFMVTNLIAEVADAYYEMMALDNLLSIVDKNIAIQSDALNIVMQQKDAGRVTQLAVNRFQAQLLNTKNLQFGIRQRLIETENQIHFLTGVFPSGILRNSDGFDQVKVDPVQAGIPSELLANRPDIRQAEFLLAAAKLDVKVARANFYPSIGISAGIGFQAFNPTFLFRPESMLYNLAGDLMAPLINRNAIKAAYNTANAQQIQAVYDYERTVLGAYVDVLNQLAKIENYSESYETKSQEVDILMESITIANSLFYSARADYAEVLLTQREALEAKIDLIEIKLQHLNAKVNIYRALGGGWN